jgi:hypothetical protein
VIQRRQSADCESGPIIWFVNLNLQPRDVLAWVATIAAAVTGGKYLVEGFSLLHSFALTQNGVATLLTTAVTLLVAITIGVWRK